ncbi:helix-turn-helix domain-containing protein [Aminobacter niigataensis]|uniref:helix-turn-helix domain-containing protein n=1 Tax=Aminobacter niigataensis TaxID=83265 RepID=UPI0024CD8C6F|nr:helix-turn-helix domain-containing protein [Aminobacter niigataensis]CAI2931888.1 HTH_17 domain-containing protein [Aminobacter niigataensis]
MAPIKLLLESEVAERLRCSTVTVKRLRLSGRLAYIPGRPVKIDEADLNAYLESVTKKAEPPKPAKPKPDKHERDFRHLARQVWLQRQSFRRSRDEKK